jgi:hypothetical protein
VIASVEKTRDHEYIANLIAEGYTSGCYPYWEIHYTLDKKHLDEWELERIAKSVAEGYIEGEILVDINDEEKCGWWILTTA